MARWGCRGQGEPQGHGPAPGLPLWAVAMGGKPPGPGEVLASLHMWARGWEGAAAAAEHQENPSQPALGFIRSLAGRGVGEGSPGPAVLCNTLLLVNSGFAAIPAQLPPEEGSGSPRSPFPSLLLPLPPIPGSSLAGQQHWDMSSGPAHLWCAVQVGC